MRHLDLFTGIGGFHLAARWAGFETVGFSEIEPYCCKLLAEKWPEIPNYGDIRTADFSGLRGSVTVLSAGVPCQPASLAGKRRGSKDDRWLWETAIDVIECVGATWIIFENPVGILSMDEFAGIYLRLESIGYEVAPPLSVPANAVGAKHRRQRVFIVANNQGERRNGLPIREATTYAMPGDCGQILANAASGIRQREASWSNGHAAQRSEALADAECQRREHAGTAESETGLRRQFANQDGEALADADRAGLEEYESCDQRQLATAVGSGGINGAGELESRIRRVAHDVPHWPYGPMPSPLSKERIPNRSHRLKALGNACCPYQCLPFFAAIAQVERGL